MFRVIGLESTPMSAAVSRMAWMVLEISLGDMSALHSVEIAIELNAIRSASIS